MAAPTGLTQLNTIPETAARLRLHRDTVYQLIARGALESVDVAPPGSHRPKTRVSDAAIAAFVRARTRKATRSAA